MTTVNTDNILI